MELNFEQNSLDYYWNEIKSLDSQNNLTIVHQYSNEYQISVIRDAVYEKIKLPQDKEKSLELFENYLSQRELLFEVIFFIKTYYSWDERAIKEELNNINEFISEANETTLKEAYTGKLYWGGIKEHRLFLRLKYKFYQNNTFSEVEFPEVARVRGRYFLFKNILEKKLTNNIVLSKEKKNPTLDDSMQRIEEILKPLSGFWNRKKIMNDGDYHRLNKYLSYLCENGDLPQELNTFNITNASIEFIRKTLYEVYRLLGKKSRGEYIKLLHLFTQFERTEKTTTHRKFSTYSGDYQRDVETMITY